MTEKAPVRLTRSADTTGSELHEDGLDAETVAEMISEMAEADARSSATIGFGRRFFPGNTTAKVAAQAYGQFAHAGRASHYPGLPSSRSMLRMQRDLEGWILNLLDAPDDTSVVFTSGGTESVIMAVRACCNSQAAKTGEPPEIVAAQSAHPCIDKAADLIGLKLLRTPLGSDYRASVEAMEEAITPRTVMLYASFPSYAYGLEDDIAAIGKLAAKHDLWLHVDACMSGFLSPFMRMNGLDIPEGGLNVPGVTSVSADLHKHGYSGKGASVLLMPAIAAEKSVFVYSDHPLPTMATPSLAGTAPGAPLASAWAVMQHLGRPGYCALANALSEAQQSFVEAIRSVNGFDVLGAPLFSIVVVTSDRYDMPSVHKGMSARNWFTSLVSAPPGLHLNIGATDGPNASRFVIDLQAAARESAR